MAKKQQTKPRASAADPAKVARAVQEDREQAGRGLAYRQGRFWARGGQVDVADLRHEIWRKLDSEHTHVHRRHVAESLLALGAICSVDN